MITLSWGDFSILFLLNLVVSAIVAYYVNYAKRSGELSAEEVSNDKEYLKKKIRNAVSEARDVLAELRVNEFKVQTGNRRLTRMNSLVEKLSLADEELGTCFWKLVNAPVLIGTAEAAYKTTEPNGEAAKYRVELKNEFFKDLTWALKRCAEIEKNPKIK